MSKEVTRYDLRVTDDGAGLYATDEPNTRGMQYVSALAYEALLAERDVLLESLINLVGLAKLGAARLDKYHAALADAEQAIAKANGAQP